MLLGTSCWLSIKKHSYEKNNYHDWRALFADWSTSVTFFTFPLPSSCFPVRLLICSLISSSQSLSSTTHFLLPVLPPHSPSTHYLLHALCSHSSLTHDLPLLCSSPHCHPRTASLFLVLPLSRLCFIFTWPSFFSPAAYLSTGLNSHPHTHLSRRRPYLALQFPFFPAYLDTQPQIFTILLSCHRLLVAFRLFVLMFPS